SPSDFYAVGQFYTDFPQVTDEEVIACLTGRCKTICVAATVLKTGSKCSFITHKLHFFACFCLVSVASKTFFNGLLRKR
ncbi:MAG: hypothetical protein Q7T35_01320, partial [Nitrosomonas sp.]|nr:hypothetical protein [Nitrosomonas sp.]